MRILIVIPAYNEQENIERVVDQLMENYPQYDYLVVNDGSKTEPPPFAGKRDIIFWICRSIWDWQAPSRQD